jgi:murein DD-endopeptidase MepM/ murein hydrolase activator NlpD
VSSDRGDPAVAASQLEAFFVRQFLAQARPQSPGMLDGGFAGDTFRDMLDTALSDSMAKSGGFGLSDTFETALGGEPPPATHVAGPMSAVATAIPARTVEVPELAHAPGAVVRPAVGRFSSRFGERVDPINHTRGLHPGLDIAAPTGTTVRAALDGKVIRAGAAGTYGNLIVLKHADGSETRYAHLSAISVKVGDTVTAGTHIGAVGTTGHSTGPHLHFEVRRNGRPVDPWPLLVDAENVVTP